MSTQRQVGQNSEQKLRLKDLPVVGDCEKSIHETSFLAGDGYHRKQTRIYDKKNPYAKHKRYINTLMREMTNGEFREFFKSVDWEKYEKYI